jgi:hypothetical protein
MRWMMLSLFAAVAGLPLVSGCVRHERDVYVQPAGYRVEREYRDRDRDRDWDYHHDRWSDEHWDRNRDRDYDRDREYWRWHRE